MEPLWKRVREENMSATDLLWACGVQSAPIPIYDVAKKLGVQIEEDAHLPVEL